MAAVEQVTKNELFTCPICLETLKSPKSLSCLHTFCEICICEYILSTERRLGSKLSSYPCPVCRTNITPTKPEDETSKWASSLPHNFTISALMEQKRSDGQDCHLCKRQSIQSKASKWCRDCCDAFCEPCLKLHNLMKLSVNHKVVDIEVIANTDIDVDLCGISEACPIHSSKTVDAYCFDHKKLCCVLCLTLQHRKCENVQAIEDIPSVKTDGAEAFEKDLGGIISVTETLKTDKEHELDHLEKTFKNIEINAAKSVSVVKNKLDSLLVSFLKELSMTQEEQKAKLQGNLDMIGQILKRIKHLTKITKTIREHGSTTQLFIHLEKMKPEIDSEIQEVIKTLRTNSALEIKFVMDEVLQQVEHRSSFGTITQAERETGTVDKYAEQVSLYSTIPLSKKTFKDIYLRTRKVIDLGGGINEGVCISPDNLVFCFGQQIKLMEIQTGNIITETTSPKSAKRLAYDTENAVLYVSCYSNHFNSVKFDGHFSSVGVIKSTTPYNGGVCIHDGNLYLIIGAAVHRMKLNSNENLKQLFTTNTDCTDLNGLAIDSKNKRLIHTSKDHAVVSTTLDGKVVFSYKDGHMKTVTSVSVNSEGLIFAGDESGCVHVISEDGKQRKTLISKCEKITRVSDVWLDKDEQSLFVSGNSGIEIYDVLYCK